MYGCQFCPCRPRKWPIHTYIHGSMPFQKGSTFSCMFTFAHADQGKTPGGAKMLKMGIHTYSHPYIHTFVLPIWFSTHPKLNVYVFITMQAEEIYIHTRKSTVFSETRNLHFHDRGHVFRQKRQKHI